MQQPLCMHMRPLDHTHTRCRRIVDGRWPIHTSHMLQLPNATTERKTEKPTKIIIISARHSSHIYCARSKHTHTRHHRSFSLQSTPWFAFYFPPFWPMLNERFFVFMLFCFRCWFRVRLLFYFIMLISSCHFISGWVLVVLFLFNVHAIIWTFYGTRTKKKTHNNNNGSSM